MAEMVVSGGGLPTGAYGFSLLQGAVICHRYKEEMSLKNSVLKNIRFLKAATVSV